MGVPSPVAVAGAGSWGTALAVQLARNGQPTRLWGHQAEHCARLTRERCNRRYLPGVSFPDGLQIVDAIEVALSGCDDLLLAVPLRGLRAVLHTVARCGRPRLRVVWACKGIEAGTRRLVHEIVAEELGEALPSAVLSGPTFAAEVAAGQPTAALIASADADLARDFVARLHGGALRVYSGTDVIGVEVAGAVKNVLAIAAGVADGLGLGANTRAAVVTRGLAEMTRLGVALGGRGETFTGLAGLGDLVLSCTDDQSRNRRLGLALARGRTLEQALAVIGQAVEGVGTARELGSLAGQLGVEMPIAAQVARVLSGACQPREAVEALLAREPTREVRVR